MKHPASFLCLATLAVLTLASHWPAPAQEEIAGSTPADAPLDAATPALFWELSAAEKTDPFAQADPFSSFTEPHGHGYPGKKPLSDESSGPSLPARWRMTIFQTSEPDAASRPTQDTALWEWLAALEQEGRATRVSDTEIAVMGGSRAHSAARREFAYPTEWRPFVKPTGSVPTVFETRDLGFMAHFTPRARQTGWRLDARLETVQWEGFSSWRDVDVEEPPGPECTALIRHPIIAAEVLATVAPMPSGTPVLLGSGPLADVPGAAATQPPRSRFMRFVFAEILPEAADATHAPPAESGSVRLLWRAFRVPRHVAAAWLWNRTESDDDAEALVFWQGQTEAAEADGKIGAAVQSAGHWSLLAPTGPVRPGGPPQASLEHMAEYIYPTEWMMPGHFGRPLLGPTAYETRNTGHAFTAQAIRAADGTTVLAEVLEEAVTLLRLDGWPVSRSDPSLDEVSPNFGTETFRGALSLPEGGVRFVGARAVLPRGAEHAAELPSQVDLLFLQAETAMPDPEAASANVPAAPPVIETQVFVFSLPAKKADAFSRLASDAAAIDDLWTLAETGEARVLASLATTTSAGSKAEVLSQHESIYPTEIEPGMLDRGLVGYTAFETYNHGTQLETAVPADPAQPVQVRLHWETAAPLRPGWADYERMVREHSDDVPYPRFFMQKLSGSVPQGGARILGVIANDIEAAATSAWPVASTGQLSASAPAGSPEHGRRHVVVGRSFVRRR